jgi:hypothetical protein
MSSIFDGANKITYTRLKKQNEKNEENFTTEKERTQRET